MKSYLIMLIEHKIIITILFLLASHNSQSQIFDNTIVKIEDILYDEYGSNVITQNECGSDSIMVRTFSTSYTFYGPTCRSGLEMSAAIINKKDKLNESESDELMHYLTTLDASQPVVSLFEKYNFKSIGLHRDPYNGKDLYDKNILFQIKIDTVFNFKISPTHGSITRKQLKTGIAVIERVPNAFDIMKITDIKIKFLKDGQVQKNVILRENILTRYEIIDYLDDDTQSIRIEIYTKAGQSLVYIFNIEEKD